MEKIDPNDILIKRKINELLAEVSNVRYSSPPDRTLLLQKAWYSMKSYRDSSKDNGTIAVCVEHYLYARFESSKGMAEAGHQVYLVAGNPFAKTIKKVGGKYLPKDWLQADEDNEASEYEMMHTKWEGKGIADGFSDRNQLAVPPDWYTVK